MSQLAAKPLIQNGRIVLQPAPNGHVIYRQPAFRHHFFQVAVAKRVPQIPPHAQNDNHVLEVSSPEQCRAVLAHRSTLPDLPFAFCNRSTFTPPDPAYDSAMAGDLHHCVFRGACHEPRSIGGILTHPVLTVFSASEGNRDPDTRI